MNEKHFKTYSVVTILLLVPVFVFAVISHFRAGDIGDLKSSIGGIGSGIRSVTERTAGLEESLNSFAKLINGVTDISNGIADTVRRNEEGLSRIRKSVSSLGELIQRIRKEGVTEE